MRARCRWTWHLIFSEEHNRRQLRFHRLQQNRSNNQCILQSWIVGWHYRRRIGSWSVAFGSVIKVWNQAPTRRAIRVSKCSTKYLDLEKKTVLKLGSLLMTPVPLQGTSNSTLSNSPITFGNSLPSYEQTTTFTPQTVHIAIKLFVLALFESLAKNGLLSSASKQPYASSSLRVRMPYPQRVRLAWEKVR